MITVLLIGAVVVIVPLGLIYLVIVFFNQLLRGLVEFLQALGD